MKAYGHSRSDKLECKYGCCTSKSGKMLNCRLVVDRANRKTGGQSELVIINRDYNEEDIINRSTVSGFY